MALFSCGGGSDELHGATIVISCSDGIGQTCTLLLETETVASKVIGSGGAVYFEGILTPGTYTSKVTIDGSEYSVDVTVSTTNIYDKDTVSGEITTRLYLYKDGDECTDITGGWANYGSVTDSIYKSTDRIILNGKDLAKNKIVNFKTANTNIDFAGCTRLYIHGDIQVVNGGYTFWYAVVNSSGKGSNFTNMSSDAKGFYVDITDIPSSNGYALQFSGGSSSFASSSYLNGYIDKIWLE